ncbi:MAG: hypothetical protein ACLT74_04460 [Christensenellales bacterium]
MARRPGTLRALKDGRKRRKVRRARVHRHYPADEKRPPEGSPPEFRAWKALEGDEMGAAEAARAGQAQLRAQFTACRRRQRWRFAMRGR